MGSLPEGTMCFYCGVEEAGYIPDGCLGAVCGTGLDLASAGKWHEHEALLYERWVRDDWPRLASSYAATNKKFCNDLDKVLTSLPKLPRTLAPYLAGTMWEE